VGTPVALDESIDLRCSLLNAAFSPASDGVVSTVITMTIKRTRSATRGEQKREACGEENPQHSTSVMSSHFEFMRMSPGGAQYSELFVIFDQADSDYRITSARQSRCAAS
jgi:hypothetical protein